MSKYIDLRIELDEIVEDEFEAQPYIYHKLKNIQRTGTNITDQHISSLVETLAQSDKWFIDNNRTILTALDNNDKHRF